MEIVKAIVIHLAVPIAGLQVFGWLRNNMRAAEIERPPIVPLFIIFATYGGWLMVILTSLFWYWSGMASLGLAYLVLIAPIVMTVLAVMLYRERRLSRYHLGAFITSGVYPCIVAALVLALFLYGAISRALP